MPSLLNSIEQPAAAQPASRARWLHDPRSIYLVQSGGLDIFLQRQDPDGVPIGARHYLCSAGVGQLTLGVAPSRLPKGWGAIAVKLPDTFVWKLDIETFEQSLLEPATNDHAVSLLNDWVSATTREVTRQRPPKHFRELSSGIVLEAEPGEVVSTNQSVLWAMVERGQAWWMGQDDLPVDETTGACPIPMDGFLRVHHALSIQAVMPSELVARGQLWQATQRHFSYVLHQALRSIESEALEQSQRLGGMVEAARLQTQAALATLSGISRARHVETGERLTPTNTRLMQALLPIGERLNISFRVPPVRDTAGSVQNPIGAVCAASDIRYRQVALKEEWWKSDCGPLLATMGEERDWVALLSVNDKRYMLYDPATDTTTPVTAENALKLGSFGYTFYRSFENKKLSGLDLVKFGLQGRWNDAARILGLSVLTGMLGVVTPIASGLLIDSVIPAADIPAIWQMLGILFITSLATGMFHMAQTIALVRLESGMDNAVQSAVMDRVLKLPATFFRKYSKGDLTERITGINTIRRALSGQALHAMLGGLFSIFNFGLLFAYSPKLAGVATLLVAVALVVIVSISLSKLGYERLLADASGRLAGLTFQYLNGITKIRIASAESRAFANWASRFALYRELGFKAQHLQNIEQTFFAGYPQLMTAAIFAVLGFALNSQEASAMTTGTYIAFNAAFGTFFGGLITLAHRGLQLINLVPVYERAKPIMHAVPELSIDYPDPGELQGGIEIASLSFGYDDGPPVLNDLSLTIRPGEYVAVVGSSGCGKSTLLRLLLGFEKASTGTITYDGQDITAVDIGALRRQLGVVLQSGKLMTGDVFSNIVGTTNLGQEQAWEAARMVGLDEDIKQMPMGMFTSISDGASCFSGGQRQRIMIARAIVHRPRILFFDEATSALDNRTQTIVTQSLDRLKATRLVIAHRLSTIVNADRIIVLDHGRIVQDGRYSELIDVPGLFQDLAKRQIA